MGRKERLTAWARRHRSLPVQIALLVVLLAAVAVFAWVVDGHYPIRRWLVLRYGGYWLIISAVFASWLLFGLTVLARIRVVLPLGERLVAALATGVYSFFLCMFIAGLFRLYSPALAIALPVVLGGIGLAGERRRLARYLRLVRRGPRLPLRGASWLGALVVLFGIAGAVLVYLPSTTPHNVSSDARWYHLPLAEHYAAAGGIIRSEEGSFVAAYPQLASILYTWVMLLPRTGIFHRVELCAHLEFSLFLATLLGVGVMGGRLARRLRPKHAWPALFLFPGIFLYDSNLITGADHVLAFWAPAILLSLLRALETRRFAHPMLMGIALAGAILTKHQAPCLVAGPVLVVLAQGVARVFREGSWRGRLVCAALAAAAPALAVAFSAPHWLKNAIWYRDPVYPLLHRYLPSTPWNPDIELYFRTIFVPNNLWAPMGTVTERLTETAQALFTFSFVPHDWGAFHGQVPVFGSLFTLLTACVPFLGRRSRLWTAVLCGYAALFVWYWGSHQDRYLQAFLPWMAAVTAAILFDLWQRGWLVRAGLTALVGLQVAWGADVPFLPGHMMGQNPHKAVIDLASSGYRKVWKERDRVFEPWVSMGRIIEKGSAVLVHGCHATLGLGHRIVVDYWQGGITYGRYESYADAARSLRDLGVTHLLWQTDVAPGTPSVAEDLVFHALAVGHGKSRHTSGPLNVVRLPDDVPSRPFGLVLFWGLGESYASGLYRVGMMAQPDPGHGGVTVPFPAPLVAARGDEATLLARAEFVVAHTQAAKGFAPKGFVRLMQRRSYVFWARER